MQRAGAAGRELVGIRGDDDDAQSLESGLRSQSLGHLPARHARHGDVDHREIGTAFGGQRQAAGAVVRGEQGEVQRAQQVLHDVEMRGVIVDEQQPAAFAAISRDRACRSAPPFAACAAGAASDSSRRTVNTVPLPSTLFSVDLAAHDLREQLGDGEAEAGAGNGAHVGALAALEGLEHALDLVGGDSHAGIGDFEFRHLAAVPHGERGAAALRVLDGIRQQVDEDLPQTLLIDVHECRQIRRPAVDELDALGRRLQPEHVDDLVEEFDQRDPVPVQAQHSVLDLGDVEDPVDEIGQMLGAAADHADGIFGRAGGAPLEQLRVAVDGIERRADLVR